MNGLKNEVVLIIGWVAAIQGALGAGGRIFGDKPWGLLQNWWDVPTVGYVAILVLGAVIASYGEMSRRRAKI